jgi:2-polyprenyl-3-methyl-5-hydroxy-6-metoxy-1,4-benzoquinol methylase
MEDNVKFDDFNKKNWNKLIKSNKPFSNTSLPEYGPYMVNEEKLQLFKDVKNKKVLELGCASGESLKFLSNKGALEVWGIDISDEQIKKAKKMQLENSFFSYHQ